MTELEKKSLLLDDWHIASGGIKNETIKSYIEKFISICEKVELPVECGWTGYPYVKDGELPKGNVYDIDTYGRKIFIIDYFLFFQRFQDDDMYMGASISTNRTDLSGWHEFTSYDMKKLLYSLNIKK